MIIRYAIQCLVKIKHNGIECRVWLNDFGYCDSKNAKIFVTKSQAIKFGKEMAKKLLNFSANDPYKLKRIFVNEVQINFYGRSEEIEV